MKILIVEDELQLANALVSYLKNEGYVCENVLNFEEAKEKVYLYDYDVVVLDIGLPDGSGLDLLKQLKQDNSIPFIEQFKNDKTLIVFGSTWPEDDALILPFINQCNHENIKFLIAPHNIKSSYTALITSRLELETVVFSKSPSSTERSTGTHAPCISRNSCMASATSFLVILPSLTSLSLKRTSINFSSKDSLSFIVFPFNKQHF